MPGIKTRIFIISDTHGDSIEVKAEQQRADVAIHCGDLTEESKIGEFRATLVLLRRLPAPLKLVIAGNHDLTLDEPTFRKRLTDTAQPIDPDLVRKNFGDFGEARRLFDDEATAARDAGIIFLDEGTHDFALANGAHLRVYASPYTPSATAEWAYQYRPDTTHDFAIPEDTHVAVTHGPPLGIMDYTDSRTRAGCPQLFAAVARARPLLHCFGHIHEGWGAKLVTWRELPSENPSHFTDIDNGWSVLIEKLTNVARNRFDTPDVVAEKTAKAQAHALAGGCRTSHCEGDANPLVPGRQTLFVNASIEGRSEEFPSQPPWIVDVELPEIRK